MIGLGPAIPNVAEFNRRATFALRGVDFGSLNQTERVAKEFQRQYDAGAISEKMQQAIYNIVHRFRKQITDKAITEYAASRAKGADA